MLWMACLRVMRCFRCFSTKYVFPLSVRRMVGELFAQMCIKGLKPSTFAYPSAHRTSNTASASLRSDNTGNEFLIDTDVWVWVLIELAKSFQQSFFLL